MSLDGFAPAYRCMKENDKIILRGSETSFMTQLIGKDIAFYKSNGERINSNSCKITY